MSRFVFAYGTLQVPAVLSRLLGRVPPLRPAHVFGFARYAFGDASYPGAVPDSVGQLHGMLIGPLTLLELSTLEAYEGERYSGIACTAHLVEEQTAPATLFVVTPQFRDLLSSSDWDLAVWLERDSGEYLEGL